MSDNKPKQHDHEPREITSDSPLTLPGFFSAMAEEKLLAAKCSECGKRMIPPRPACYQCGSRAIEIEEQPMSGKIISYTEVYRPPPPFADLAPITIGTIELDSGARITGRVTAPYDEVDIGTSVEVKVKQPEEITVDTELHQEKDWPLHVFELV